MLQFLDAFLTIFHSAFVLFVLFGWAHPKTQKAHVTALLLTFLAWMLLGLYRGVIGYCPLTDWHWDVKRALGETGMSGSFVGYMIEHYLGLSFSRSFYDAITAGGLIFGSLMSFLVHRKNRNSKSEASSQVA